MMTEVVIKCVMLCARSHFLCAICDVIDLQPVTFNSFTISTSNTQHEIEGMWYST